MIGIRKSLDFVFLRRELKILDDIMPETTKRTEEERRQLQGEVRLQSFYVFVSRV
jgi:sodium bicarbonate transporter 10